MRGIQGTGWSYSENGFAWCRSCRNKLGAKPQADCPQEHFTYYEKNLSNSSKWNKRMRAEIRTQAITYLGGRCKRCDTCDIRILTFNHINGGGHKERQSLDRMTFWRAILRGERPDIELLCHNCQVLCEYERGIRN